MGLLYTSPQCSRLPIQLRIRAPGVPGLPARKTRLARAQEKAAAVPKRSVKAAIPLSPRLLLSITSAERAPTIVGAYPAAVIGVPRTGCIGHRPCAPA